MIKSEAEKSNHCILQKGQFAELKITKQNKLFMAKIVIVQPAISRKITYPAIQKFWQLRAFI